MNDRPAAVTVGELISVASVPTVVALDEVDALRERLRAEGDALSPETMAALGALVEQYFVAQDDNRQAVETILESLARPDGAGGAFLVRGVHGCGKSHLLAVLALLCEFPAAWNAFAATHPELARLARAFGPSRGLLVVPIDLEQHGADADLEAIVFAAIERELAARGASGSIAPRSYVIEVARHHIAPHYPDFEQSVTSASGASWAELSARDPERAAALARQFAAEHQLPITFHRSRAETIAELRAVMNAAGLTGVVLLVDELGLFLSAKPRTGLDADAGFLQFIAQRTRSMPLWIVASVQRSLEDIGDIDRRTLRQIRDRFRTDLSLNIAQLRAVIERKLILRRDPAAYRAAIDGLYECIENERARPCFSREDLAALYPLHPMALECLETLAGSFLSKTRTLIAFVQQAAAAHLPRPADRLLTLDRVFDFFEGDLRQSPEAGRQWRAYAFLRDNMARLTPRVDLGHRLAKALTLISLAGQRWTARELADALIGSDLPEGERTLAAVRETLGSLRRRGAYVEMTPASDRSEALYFLEMSSAAPETARRRLAEIDATIAPDDRRVIEAALAACQDDRFPLARFREPGSCVINWMNTRRTVSVSVRDLATVAPGAVANIAEALASPDSEEDACLFIAPPLAGQEDAWAVTTAPAEGGGSPRFTPALLVWLPRQPTTAESDLLREHAAIEIALADPALEQSRQAREVREHLLARRAALADEVRPVTSRLYHDGRVLDGRGEEAASGASLTPLQGDWRRALESIFGPALSAVFPDFASVAPRARLASSSPCRQIIDEFVRSGAARPALGSPLAQHLEDYAEPLGIVARGDEGARLVVDTQSPVIADLLTHVPQASQDAGADAAVPYPRLERLLARSAFGLPADLTQVLVAALLRRGHLIALDGFLAPLGLDQIALPLRDHIAFVRQAEIIAARHHQPLGRLARALLAWSPERIDLPTQEALWQRLVDWGQAHQAMASDLETRLASLIAGIGQQTVEWPAAFAALRAANALAAAIDGRLTAKAGLERIVSTDADLAALRWMPRLVRFLRDRGAAVSATCAYVTDPDFALPAQSQLSRERARLLEAIAGGEAMIDDDRIVSACEHMLAAYRKHYLAWHDAAHAPEVFRPYLDLRESPGYRAMAALDPLPLADAAGQEAVDSLLDRQLERHCPGLELPAALESSPACPRCRLRLGQSLDLVPAHELASAVEETLRGRLRALAEAERRDTLDRRLADEPDAELAGRVRALLALPHDAEPADALAAATEDVVAWLARALRKHAARMRRLDDLSAALRGRELPRGEIERALRRWLDGDDPPSDDDYVEIT